MKRVLRKIRVRLLNLLGDGLAEELKADNARILKEEFAKFRALFEAEAATPFEAAVVEGNEPAWGAADRQGLRAYLESPSGKRLRAMMVYWEQRSNRLAALKTENCQNESGFARGWHTCSAWILEGLSANLPPHPEDDMEGRTGAPALHEQYAP